MRKVILFIVFFFIVTNDILCDTDSDVKSDIINAKSRRNNTNNHGQSKVYDDLNRDGNTASLSNAKLIDVYNESKISSKKTEKNTNDVQESNSSTNTVKNSNELQQISETEKNEPSSGNIWKTVGVAAAAVAGTAAVGTGLYFGINALLNKKSNTENTQENNSKNIDEEDKSTSSSDKSEKSKYISINVDNYGIVRKKTESNSLRNCFNTIDAKLSNIIDKETIPSGENYVEDKETSRVLKDSYNYIVSNTAKTASMFDVIINSSGGKNAEGIPHKTVLQNNLSSKIARMKEIETLLSSPVLINSNTLQNEYEKLGTEVSAFISDYASKNDSLNGTNELKNDLYFDVSTFQQEVAEYIDNNRAYFPEYNVSKASVSTMPINDTLNKLNAINPSDKEEKIKVDGVKDVLKAIDLGIPFSDKEIEIVEKMISANEVKNFEEKYNISISDYIGNAKSKIDSGNKSIKVLMGENARSLDLNENVKTQEDSDYNKNNDTNSDGEVKLGKDEYHNDEKLPLDISKNSTKEDLKKKLLKSIEDGTPLERNVIDQISIGENGDILSNEILKEFFSKERFSVQILDEYYKGIKNGQKISEGVISAIMNDKYSLNRLISENPEYYKKLHLQDKGYKIEKILSSNTITKNEMMSLILSNDFADIVKENEHLVQKLTERIECFNKLDNIMNKNTLSVNDFKEINSSNELKNILINDTNYKKLSSDFTNLQNIHVMVENIVNDINNGKEVNHDEICYVMNNDLGRAFVNEYSDEIVKKVDDLHSKIVETYTESKEVKDNINGEENSLKNLSGEHALLTKIEEKNGEIPEIDSGNRINEKEKESIVTKIAKYGVLGTAVGAFVDNINKNINQENIEYNHESPSESVYNVHENEHYDVHKTASFNANKAKKE